MKLPLLQLLDREFTTRFRRPELPTLASATAIEKLFDTGVLTMVKETDAVACPLGMHEGNGLVPVVRDENGEFTGFCAEHGEKVRVPAQEAEWVLFNAEKWCQAVRTASGLIDTPVTGMSGFMFAGTYRTSNRKVGIVITSAQAQGNPQDFQPHTAGLEDYVYLMLDDSQPAPGDHYACIPASKAFSKDMVKLDGSAIGTALASLTKPSDETHYLKFTDGSKLGEKLSRQDYKELTAAKETKKYDLVLDLAGGAAWRSGKKITKMAQKKQKGRQSRLSDTGLKLIADYLQHPLTPLAPYNTGPYYGSSDSREKKSPQVMLLNMRVTLKLKDVLKQTINPSGTSGDGLYQFDPGADFTYILIMPPEDQ